MQLDLAVCLAKLFAKQGNRNKAHTHDDHTIASTTNKQTKTTKNEVKLWRKNITKNA